MKRIMISAMSSGSGKTIITGGLMRALQRRGLSVLGFKCGPDYIDPMFHSRVLGIPGRNLDLFLQGEEGMKRTFSQKQADIAVIEGAMGYYDGISGTDENSAWQIAGLTGTPVILVVRPRGISLTLAAQIRGMQSFRENNRIAGVIFTDCKMSLYLHLKTILEKETGVPVLGYLPPMEEAVLPSRRLGLVTADEIEDLRERFDAIAGSLEENCDMNKCLEIADKAEENDACRDWCFRNAGNNAGQITIEDRMIETPGKAEDGDLSGKDKGQHSSAGRKYCCRIGTAMDEAFSFYYADSLDLLREYGAEIIPFSPIHDPAIPDVDALYLGGGYPELYLKELSGNASMRESVRRAVEKGMPAVAECGGFMYLHKSIRAEDGTEYPMAGVLPGSAYKTESLRRFGYLTLKADTDSLLFRCGEKIPAHEFHYWESTECGGSLTAEKTGGRNWKCGYTSSTLYAAFPHLHFGGEMPLAERFVRSAEKWHREASPVRRRYDDCIMYCM